MPAKRCVRWATVIDAGSGMRALAIIAQRDDIDEPFTDVVMVGGMTGCKFADAARRLRPGPSAARLQSARAPSTR